MKYQEARQQIEKSQLEPVYLLWGQETYLINLLLRAFKEQVIPESETSLNVTVLDSQEVPIQAAVQEANSLPFFGDRKVVIVTDAYFLTAKPVKNGPDHRQEVLLDYLKDPSPTSVLVLVAPYAKLDNRRKLIKSLMQQKGVVDCSPLSNREREQFVLREAEERQLPLTAKHYEQIIYRVGPDLGLLMKELDKLTLAYQAGLPLNAALINDLVPRSKETVIFDVIDALNQKNKKVAMAIYHQLMSQNEEPIGILALLLSQYSLLLKVKYMKSTGLREYDIVSRLGVHEYRVKLAYQAVDRFPVKQLEAIFLKLLENNYLAKTGQGDPSALVEWLIIEACR